LRIHWCALENHASLGNAETGSIARLHTLDLCGTRVGVEQLICGTRGQDGSLILYFSHLQELLISIPEEGVLPALQEMFKRAPKLRSLHLRGTPQHV